MTHSRTPDLMPVLSRGKHRSPRKGACFMELASYLAGERWSDHPQCTHPLLSALARDVNDAVSDTTRVWLAPLIPEVIGLTGDEPRVDAWIARQAALAALPVVSADRQNLVAVGLLRCEEHLAELEHRDLWDLSPETCAALEQTPAALAWAQQMMAGSRGPLGEFRRRSAPVIVHNAVAGIAATAYPACDRILVDLLTRTVHDCRGWLGHEVQDVPDERWAEACAMTVPRQRTRRW